jgi:hypothetical protein
VWIKQLPHAFSAHAHESADLRVTPPTTIVYACVQSQGFFLIAGDITCRQQLTDFKSCVSLTKLYCQLSLGVTIQPQRSGCGGRQNSSAFLESLPTEDATDAPKLRLLTAIYADALSLSRLYFFLSRARHPGEMVTAMTVARHRRC